MEIMLIDRCEERRGEERGGEGGSRVLSVQSNGLSRLAVAVCLRNFQNKSFIACLDQL